MRFHYEPDSEELSAYVAKEDFDFAANKDVDEYRIFSRNFKKDNVLTFLEEFTKFVCNMFSSLNPQEKIKDILIISKFGKGYSWTSLLKMDFNESTLGFFENLFNYGNHVMKEQSKDFPNNLPRQELAKLNLINHLVTSLNLPEPWSRKKKAQENQVDVRIKELKKIIKNYENKFQFSSDEMLTYYADDEIPDDEMLIWKNVYFELKTYENMLKKQDALNKILNIWMES